MKIHAETLEELNEAMANHPAIRAYTAKVARAKRPTRGAPALQGLSTPKRVFTQASLDNPQVGALVSATRRVTQCTAEGRALVRAKVQKRRPDAGAEVRFARKWAGVEHDYHTMVELTGEVLDASPMVAAVAKAARDVEDIHRFANPAFLGTEELALFKELGVDDAALMDFYRYSYLPDRKLVDRALRRKGAARPASDVDAIRAMPFVYAPERLMQKGALKLTGHELITAGVIVAIAGAITAVAGAIQEHERRLVAIAGMKLTWNIALLLVAYVMWDQEQRRLEEARSQLSQLQAQYDAEVAKLERETDGTGAAGPATPGSVSREFGYVIGNMSRSKREAHVPSCSFLRLARPDRLRTFDDLAAAHTAGLDNCAFCIGGSTR